VELGRGLRRHRLGPPGSRPLADRSEYAQPLSGEALGSTAQSSTAAVALDWLAHDTADAAGVAR